MKRLMLLMMAMLLLVLTACTTYMYGVPLETWDRMSEPERIQAMEVHKQRQIARQQAAAERAAQRQAYQAEQQRQQAAEAEARAEAMDYRVEAIYRGDGYYGDLLRVRIQNGMANFRGKHRPFDPIAFQIANGETKTLTLHGNKRRQVDITAFYDGATLYLDQSDRRGRERKSAQLQYEQRWSRGVTYTRIYTGNRANLQNADVRVEIVDDRRFRRDRYRPGPRTVIVREQPETIIIREQPETVIIKEKPKKIYIKEKPKKIYVKEKPRKVYVEEKPKKVVVKERPKKVSVYDDHKFKPRRDKLAKQRKALNKKQKALKQQMAEHAAEQEALTEQLKQLTKRPKRRSLINQTEEQRERHFANVDKSQEVAKQLKFAKADEKRLQQQQKQLQEQQKQLDVQQKELDILQQEIDREEREYKRKYRNGKR